MKKLLYIFMVVATIAICSCSNSSTKNSSDDSLTEFQRACLDTMNKESVVSEETEYEDTTKLFAKQTSTTESETANSEATNNKSTRWTYKFTNGKKTAFLKEQKNTNGKNVTWQLMLMKIKDGVEVAYIGNDTFTFQQDGTPMVDFCIDGGPMETVEAIKSEFGGMYALLDPTLPKRLKEAKYIAFVIPLNNGDNVSEVIHVDNLIW